MAPSVSHSLRATIETCRESLARTLALLPGPTRGEKSCKKAGKQRRGAFTRRARRHTRGLCARSLSTPRAAVPACHIENALTPPIRTSAPACAEGRTWLAGGLPGAKAARLSGLGGRTSPIGSGLRSFDCGGCAGYELGRFRLAQAAEREDSEHRERAPPVAQVCLIGPCDRGRRSTFLSGGTLK